MLYEAEYENNEIEVFNSNTDAEAIKKARTFEKNNGIIFNIYLLDDDHNQVTTIF